MKLRKLRLRVWALRFGGLVEIFEVSFTQLLCVGAGSNWEKGREEGREEGRKGGKEGRKEGRKGARKERRGEERRGQERGTLAGVE